MSASDGPTFPPLPPNLFDDLLRLPASRGGGPVRTPEDWAAKRDDIRSRFRDLLGKPPASRPEARVRVLEETDAGPFLRRKIAYPVEVDEEAEAWLLIPHGLRGRMPGILCLHGTTADGKDAHTGLTGEAQKSYGRELALRGYVTLTPDHFCTGARKPAEGHYETAAFYRKHPDWSAVGKSIWDQTAAVDVLQSLPQVDSDRIGCIGHSLGGHGSLFFAAWDERVRAAVCNCGATTWRADSRRLAWSRDRWYVYLPKLRELFLRSGDARDGVPVDIPEIAALVAPRAFMDISALNDAGFAYEAEIHLQDAWWKLSEVYDLLGAPERFAYMAHRGKHSFPDFARQCAYTWLERHLLPETAT